MPRLLFNLGILYIESNYKSSEGWNKFIKYHEPSIPLEIVYGINTKNVKVASEFEDMIDPDYFEKAVEMHYDKTVKRPDITFFNLGALGTNSSLRVGGTLNVQDNQEPGFYSGSYNLYVNY